MTKEKQESVRKYLDAKTDKRLVQIIAKQMKGNGLTMDELMDAGMEGIVRASKHNDEVTKDRNPLLFHAYAIWWIRQAMRQAIEEREKDKK